MLDDGLLGRRMLMLGGLVWKAVVVDLWNDNKSN